MRAVGTQVIALGQYATTIQENTVPYEELPTAETLEYTAPPRWLALASLAVMIVAMIGLSFVR